jgi:hypothetical protein
MSYPCVSNPFKRYTTRRTKLKQVIERLSTLMMSSATLRRPRLNFRGRVAG